MTKPDGLPFKDAIKFWESKVPMEPKAYKELWNEQKVNAFAVSGVSNMDTVMDLYRSLGKAISEGQSFGAWKKQHADLWEQKGWTGKSAWRVDNVFRTNVQTALQVGRYNQMSQSVDDMPFWMYSAVSDRRTRPTHLAMNGQVYRFDDPFWDSWYPPNGFRCRCTVRPLSEGQVKRKGVEVQSGMPGLIEPVDPKTGRKMPARPLVPDPGFNFHPGKAHYQPDLSKYPATLKQRFLEKFLERACPDDRMDFSESSCFKRLKKHLKQEDLESLQTLAWAEGERMKKEYREWVAGVIESMQPKGEVYPMANLPLKVCNSMEKQPQLALVVIDDHAVTHLVRETKKARGQALTADEVTELADRFAAAEWYLDQEDPAVVMTWVRSGDELVKMIIRTDRAIGKGIANQVVTAGVVKDYSIESNLRYRKVGM
ncbi:phage head morphogenesis protein [Desulforegula conservatrix]|uniref:phage head morphogenesis protein n=1 Tax=Desulforegula conservatrix TaxID=153026 RepID=UPI0003FBB87B|nr:phage minor head protein [Desulforegula conservatrix]